jgi:DNA end-binding protein Ku
MGAKPYAVLLEALMAERRWAVGQGVLFGRDQLILLRPMEGLLCMELLHYQSELRSAAEFLEKVQEIPTVGREELRLAAKLIQTSTRKKFDFARYVDEQTAELKRKIESSVEEAVTAPGEPEAEEAPVINLMDALRKSVARAHHGSKAASRPARKPRRAKRTSHRRSAG